MAWPPILLPLEYDAMSASSQATFNTLNIEARAEFLVARAIWNMTPITESILYDRSSQAGDRTESIMVAVGCLLP